MAGQPPDSFGQPPQSSFEGHEPSVPQPHVQSPPVWHRQSLAQVHASQQPHPDPFAFAHPHAQLPPVWHRQSFGQVHFSEQPHPDPFAFAATGPAAAASARPHAASSRQPFEAFPGHPPQSRSSRQLGPGPHFDGFRLPV